MLKNILESYSENRKQLRKYLILSDDVIPDGYEYELLEKYLGITRNLLM